MSKRFSLKGLQALEATIRCGSFVAAAEELDVTPAAVSQLVRALEERANRQMFYRINRKLVLSEASELLAPRLTALFSELEEISAELSGDALRSQLIISVPPSVATWLSSRIAAFVDEWGPLDFTLRGDEDPVDIERYLVDIRWSFGEQNYRSEHTEVVYQDHAFAVCSPVFFDKHGPFDDQHKLLQAPLIHTDWGPSSAKYPSWDNWFEAADIARHRPIGKGIVAHSSQVAVDLASNGLGIALCQGFYLPQLIANGALMRAHSYAVPLAQPYCLTVPARSSERPVVQAFKQWLMLECRKYQIDPA